MNVSLYQATSALNAMDRWLEVIAENIASASVPGFKKQEFSFAAVAASAGARTALLPQGQESTNFRSGDFRVTGVKTDAAVDGPGFFEVVLPDGRAGFTRDGEFRIGTGGQLLTKNGFPVQGEGGPIQLDPNNRAELSISTRGEVSQGAARKGTLKLVEFAEVRQLTRINGGYFLADQPGAGAGAATVSTVRQGVVESANTSTTTDMAQLLTAMKFYEANHKTVQAQDERMSRSINELTPV